MRFPSTFQGNIAFKYQKAKLLWLSFTYLSNWRSEQTKTKPTFHIRRHIRSHLFRKTSLQSPKASSPSPKKKQKQAIPWPYPKTLWFMYFSTQPTLWFIQYLIPAREHRFTYNQRSIFSSIPTTFSSFFLLSAAANKRRGKTKTPT